MSEADQIQPVPSGPPVAAKVPTRREFHGDVYVDNYEWLRDKSNPELIELLEAENAWTALRTADIEDLTQQVTNEIASRTKEDDTTVPQRDGNWWYYRRTWKGKQYPAEYRVPASGPRPSVAEVVAGLSDEQLVWDGNALAEGREFFSTSEFLPAPNGKIGVLGVDFLGDEHFTLRIFDIDSGVVVDDAVSGAGYGLAWSADSSSIFYAKVDESWRTYQVWLHEVGTNPASDRLIFQEDDPKFEIWHVPSRDGQWVVITSQSSTTTEVRLVSTGQPLSEPIVVCWRSHGLEYVVEPAGDHLLITHNANVADFEVATAPIRTSKSSEWVSILTPNEGERISGVEAFRDFFVVSMRSGGETSLRVARRSPAVAGTVDTQVTYREPHERHIWSQAVAIPTRPLSTTTAFPPSWWESTEFIFATESVLRPSTVYSYDVPSESVSELKVTEVPNYNPEDYVEEGVHVTAADGTHIPLAIIRRRDIQADGTHPGYIYGYGSYEVSNDPLFRTHLISMLERGVVIGWTHIRGGGELGRQWYLHGKMLEKKNTFTDFVDSATWMIESGWVAPERLCADGRSAGGMLMGVVANLAPERFRAIHAGVPFVDSLTTMLKPELPLTAGEWEEWGNPIEDPEVYSYMKSYSPTENVAPREYPAILATTSLNDIRVSYVEPTKWVQILRETTTNDPLNRPILEHIEMVAGHAGKSGRYARWRQQAFICSWLMRQIGAA
ncbi:S9 family peptidase [Arcanobacterium haemolyticum]|nr:S9 family peptidase [Arcanobacterium haemolyticum]